MLTSLEIENFKGIAARQRIDFAPLTLLFGANNAGKSTVLQALLYLRELIVADSADVSRTSLGGRVVDLGGFARLVHLHDASRTIRLRAEFTTRATLDVFGRIGEATAFENLDDEIETAWIELHVRQRSTPNFRGAIVDRVEVGVNGVAEPLVSIVTENTLRPGDGLFVGVNMHHPILGPEGPERMHEWAPFAMQTMFSPPDAGKEDDEGKPDERIGPAHPGHFLIFSDDRLMTADPNADDPHWLFFFARRTRLSALPSPTEWIELIRPQDTDLDEPYLAIRRLIEIVVLGTTRELLRTLDRSLYIGPLRAVPSRTFLMEGGALDAGWADGLAAWSELLTDRAGLTELTNRWLRRLGTNCQIEVQELFAAGASAEDVSSRHAESSVRRILLRVGDGVHAARVLPSEVGTGISQVVPVIVAGTRDAGEMVIVEQPELHVHPAVQVGLGDLLIETISGEGSRRSLLVETHSEHLILRLLRRIRETTTNELPDGAPAFSGDKLSVLYVEARPEGVSVRRLRVNELGEFLDRWPQGFFEERAKELF